MATSAAPAMVARTIASCRSWERIWRSRWTSISGRSGPPVGSIGSGSSTGGAWPADYSIGLVEVLQGCVVNGSRCRGRPGVRDSQVEGEAGQDGEQRHDRDPRQLAVVQQG